MSASNQRHVVLFRSPTRPALEKTLSTTKREPATESDPFQSGSSNADKLRREGARRQDLLVHAKTRSNAFYRRKG